MALKCIIDNPVEVPGPLRDYYQRTSDGKFALMLEGEPAGYVKSEKLAEFRNNNRALHSAKTELEAKLKAFEGFDLAEHLSLKEKLAAFGVADPSALAEKHKSEIAAAAAEAVKAEAAAEQAKLVAALDAEKAAHVATQFKNVVSAEFLRAGGRASAVDYIITLAGKTFAMKDGQITTEEFSTANPGEHLTLSEWMEAQRRAVDFAFLPSRGGGAGSSQSVIPGKRTVAMDPVELGRNIAAIAAGDVTVEQF